MPLTNPCNFPKAIKLPVNVSVPTNTDSEIVDRLNTDSESLGFTNSAAATRAAPARCPAAQRPLRRAVLQLELDEGAEAHELRQRLREGDLLCLIPEVTTGIFPNSKFPGLGR